MRLSVRLALLVFLVETCILGLFATTVFCFSRKLYYDSLDFALQSNAEALASLVEEEDEGDGPELEFADEIMRRFSRLERPDLFAIILENGSVLEKSASLDPIPPFVMKTSTGVQFRDFENRGNKYRGIILSFERRVEENPNRKFHIRVFFASSDHMIRKQVESILKFLIWSVSAGLLLSALLAYVVSLRGLAPLRRLARDTGGIHEGALSQRLCDECLPHDLAPLAGAMNDLLSRLEKAFEREKRFSCDAAHELRTPVATLKSGIQAALLSNSNPDDCIHVLRELLDDVERLESLCDSLLVTTKEQGAGDGRDGISLAEWAGEIHKSLEHMLPLADMKNIRLTCKVPLDQYPNIFLNTNRPSTHRILNNLVDNAIRHNNPGTSICVHVEISENMVFLRVEDDGSGIISEDLECLFERFHRADKSRSRDSGGQGLGLYISRTLARTFDGDILYQPAEPHGSSFIWKCRIFGRDANA